MKTLDGQEITEKLLIERFPLCFGDRYKDMKETAMCWGLECGLGWLGIIYEACEKAEPIIAKWIQDNKNNPNFYIDYAPRLSQVKEKFSTLRMYWSSYIDGLDEIESEAEKKSETTCEQCGKPGEFRGKNWYYTSCYQCAKPEDRDNLEMLENRYDESVDKNHYS